MSSRQPEIENALSEIGVEDPKQAWCTSVLVGIVRCRVLGSGIASGKHGAKSDFSATLLECLAGETMCFVSK